MGRRRRERTEYLHSRAQSNIMVAVPDKISFHNRNLTLLLEFVDRLQLGVSIPLDLIISLIRT